MKKSYTKQQIKEMLDDILVEYDKRKNSKAEKINTFLEKPNNDFHIDYEDCFCVYSDNASPGEKVKITSIGFDEDVNSNRQDIFEEQPFGYKKMKKGIFKFMDEKKSTTPFEIEVIKEAADKLRKCSGPTLSNYNKGFWNKVKRWVWWN